MLKRFRASAMKDLLILSRDKAGLAILFFMPVVLIFIMTVIQDSAYSTISQRSLPVIFVDNDRDSLGHSIYTGLASSEMVKLVTEQSGEPYTSASARAAVGNGEYLLAIIIPEGASEVIRTSVSQNIEKALIDEEAEYDSLSPVEVVVFVDPAAQQSFITTVSAMLREFISEMKTRLIFQTFTIQLSELLPDSDEPEFSNDNVIQFRQEFAMRESVTVYPNSVQHNVPAWTIFAMFFIAIPLATSLVREKSEGSMIRLRTLPGSYLDVLTGKFAVYFVVCIIQFILMMLVGLLVLPLVGMPVLNLGGNLPAVAIVAISNAFAATAFGLLVGTLSTSHQQGAIGGSVAVLILAALGGIWVPAYVMPVFMQSVSSFSPLNWGLSGFYDIFLRGEGVAGVLFNSGKLIVFGFALVAVSYFYQQWKLKA